MLYIQFVIAFHYFSLSHLLLIDKFSNCCIQNELHENAIPGSCFITISDETRF